VGNCYVLSTWILVLNLQHNIYCGNNSCARVTLLPTEKKRTFSKISNFNSIKKCANTCIAAIIVEFILEYELKGNNMHSTAAFYMYAMNLYRWTTTILSQAYLPLMVTVGIFCSHCNYYQHTFIYKDSFSLLVLLLFTIYCLYNVFT
jgi:hypothetical protein